MSSRLSIMGVGFVGQRYCDLYPTEVSPELRSTITPTQDDVLWLRSTVDNYAPTRGDLKTDIATNLTHTMEVLPNVRGVFNAVSSWFVYGANSGHDRVLPAREGDRCDPRGFYSITKLAMEQMVASYCDTAAAGLVSGPSAYRILRLCNVIGNDPGAGKTKNALVHMIDQVVRGEEITLYSGDCYRAVMHVSDVCRALNLCLSTPATLNSITNIGPTSSTRMYDLIQHAIAVTGSKSKVTLIAPPRFHQIVQVPDFHMDTTKLHALGFVPEMDAYQAVERVIANMTP